MKLVVNTYFRIRSTHLNEGLPMKMSNKIFYLLQIFSIIKMRKKIIKRKFCTEETPFYSFEMKKCLINGRDCITQRLFLCIFCISLRELNINVCFEFKMHCDKLFEELHIFQWTWFLKFAMKNKNQWHVIFYVLIPSRYRKFSI